MLPKNLLRIVSAIVLFSFLTVHIILDGNVYAQDFNTSLDQGKNMGYDTMFNYSPLFLNNTMQNKGLGSSNDVTPKMDEAIQQQNNYQDYYSNPANMAHADTGTDVNNFVVNTSQTRQQLDMSRDTTFGNRCLQYDINNNCTMWSTSADLIGATYPDCTEVNIPQYDDPPRYETCTMTDAIDDVACNTRTFALIQTEDIHTTCDKTTIDYKPGQIYAVCRDYYEIYRDQISDERSQNDCYCKNISGALCREEIPTHFTVIPPWPDQPPFLRFMGTSAENFYDRGVIDGDRDYCSFQRFNYYSQYKKSVIERVVLQYDNPCGATLNQRATACTVKDFEQCDASGLNCNIIVKDSVPSGVDPASDPRACENISGSVGNYEVCLNYNTVKFNNRVLTNTPETETSTTQQYGDTINWTRVYGGSDIQPLFNYWYSKVSFRCKDQGGNCQAFIDQGCTLYGRKCTDLDCNNYEYTYKCGGTGAVKRYERAYNCLGAVKCMGTECKDASYNANTDFASAAAAMEVLNQYRADATNAEIFPGEEQVCMSNPKDCCEKPDGGMSIGDYVKFGRSAIEAYSLLNGGSAATWASYADAMTYVSTLGESGTLSGLTGIGSSANSVNIVTSAENVGMIGESTLQSMGYNVAYESGGQVVCSGATSAVSALATVATIATIAFVIYTVASYVYNWVYQCEDEDIITSQKDGMRLCHEIGQRCVSEGLGICFKEETVSCCFNSILSRVLHEQARPLINKPWGNPEEPNCSGFSPGELASIDFSKVDLTEYMQYVTYNLSIPPEKYQEIIDKTRGMINDKYQQQNQ